MNIQQHSLDIVEVQPNQVKDVSQCVLHSIMFTRALGLMRPTEGSIDALGFYYVRCDDKTIESYIDTKVNEFFDSWSKKNWEPSRRIIVISFDERRTRSGLFGFSKVEEKVRWEQWVIPFSINKSNSGTDTLDRKERLVSDVRKVLLNVVRIVNENRNIIPPLTNKEVAPFPYEITFPTTESNPGIFATLGNILKAPTGPLLSN